MSSIETIELLYVLDTHALVWYLVRDKRLGTRASAIFTAAEQGKTELVISAIVIAEMFYLNKKQKYFEDFAQTYADLKNALFSTFLFRP